MPDFNILIGPNMSFSNWIKGAKPLPCIMDLEVLNFPK
jgi:hypothetical protein